MPAVAGWLTKSSATGLRMLVGDAGVSAHGPKLAASPRMGVQQGGSSLQAGLLIIGDEILSGAVSDSNAAWLGKLLHLRGVKLCRVEVVGDCVEEIVDSVHRIRERAAGGPVFTSGGIGPTHDDVTYAAIGAAFGPGEPKQGARWNPFVHVVAWHTRVPRVPLPDELRHRVPAP